MQFVASLRFPLLFCGLLQLLSFVTCAILNQVQTLLMRMHEPTGEEPRRKKRHEAQMKSKQTAAVGEKAKSQRLKRRRPIVSR